MRNATMRAAAIERFGGPLQMRELPLPLPGPGQVRIRIAAAAVNPTDLGMVEGRYRWREPVRFPLVPGWELAGRVDAVGEGVTNFHVGDQVIAPTVHPLTQAGSYAEYVVLPEKYLVPVPSETEMTEVSGLPLRAAGGGETGACAFADAADQRAPWLSGELRCATGRATGHYGAGSHTCT